MHKKKRRIWTYATVWATQSFSSRCVFRVCLCLGPKILKREKKTHSHSGHPRYFPLSTLTSILTEITGYSSFPLISPKRRAAAPVAQGPRCACHSPRGEGRLASPLHSCPASGGSRGLQRVLRKAGGRKPPQPYPKSPGLGPGPRPLLSAAVEARRPSSPAPDSLPPALAPTPAHRAEVALPPSAAARLWVAQRPRGSRTAGEARGRPSHPRRSRHLPCSSHHCVHGLRERRTPKPPRPPPAGACLTPPSGSPHTARSPAPGPPHAQARTFGG